ncbi:MAG: hypothetical protein FLDDKLPJ_02253 [Phycisphaerae bacterium]|nr:hypothetical protein [Phycisphaerae bacterium]
MSPARHRYVACTSPTPHRHAVWRSRPHTATSCSDGRSAPRRPLRPPTAAPLPDGRSALQRPLRPLTATPLPDGGKHRSSPWMPPESPDSTPEKRSTASTPAALRRSTPTKLPSPSFLRTQVARRRTRRPITPTRTHQANPHARPAQAPHAPPTRMPPRPPLEGLHPQPECLLANHRDASFASPPPSRA